MTAVTWPPAKKPNNSIQALFMMHLLQNGFLHLKFSLILLSYLAQHIVHVCNRTASCFCLNIKKQDLLWGWLSTSTGWPGRLWNHESWGYWKAIRTTAPVCSRWSCLKRYWLNKMTSNLDWVCMARVWEEYWCPTGVGVASLSSC